MQRDGAIDGMRGIAILSVIICHWIGSPFKQELAAVGETIATLLSASAGHGVDVFFVVSGYLIGGIVIREHTSPRFVQTFLARRALRILPLYVLCVIVFWNLFAGARLLIEASPPLWSYAAFVQNLFMAAGHQALMPIAAYWSLAVEEQFYFSVVILAALFGMRGVLALALVMLATGPIFRAAGEWPDIMFFTLARADPIGLGLFLAWLPVRAGRLLCGAWLGLGLLTFDGYAIVAAMTGLGILARTSPGVALVTSPAWLREIGRMCFSLYLVHEFVRAVAFVIVGGRPGPLALAVAFGVMVAACWALERWISDPFIQRGKRLRYS